MIRITSGQSFLELENVKIVRPTVAQVAQAGRGHRQFQSGLVPVGHLLDLFHTDCYSVQAAG